LCQAQAPPQYTITTIAGNCVQSTNLICQGNYGGDGGPATNAFLFGPSDVLVDSSGNLYFSDTVNNRIRQVVLSTAIINTVAGNGSAGYFGDGASATAIGAELYSPTGITFDGSGDLYIADTGNAVIREVLTPLVPFGIGSGAGIISTVAGDNTLGFGFFGDLGPATAAQLSNPTGVAVDPAGNIYIADPDNNVVRVVCANQTPIACQGVAAGDINTFAGNQPTGASYTGDGGPATKALLNDPVAVLLDTAGNLYISDSGNNAIRKVNTSGIISTVAGMGPFANGYSGDGGQATLAELNGPKGMAMDSSGNLYIADSVNCVIRMVELSGVITTIAGNQAAGAGYSGDKGPATSAQLYFPGGRVRRKYLHRGLREQPDPAVDSPTAGSANQCRWRDQRSQLHGAGGRRQHRGRFRDFLPDLHNGERGLAARYQPAESLV
jgi:sugar lactone lactonase YvrE